MQELSFWPRFLLAALAAWRITHLLAYEDGPADLIVKFRAWLGPGFFGKLMDCFNCLSFWVAAALAPVVVDRPLLWLLVWPALSGAACLLERATREPVVLQAMEDPEPQPERSASWDAAATSGKR